MRERCRAESSSAGCCSWSGACRAVVLLFVWLRSLPGGPGPALLGERATPEQAGRADRRRSASTSRSSCSTASSCSGCSPAIRQLDRVPAIRCSTCSARLPGHHRAGRRRDDHRGRSRHPAGLPGRPAPGRLARQPDGRRLPGRRRRSRSSSWRFLLKYVFAVRARHWLPAVRPASAPGIDATRVTGFFILDGLLTREWDAAWDALRHLILPAIALATIPFAVIFRITRASVLDVLGRGLRPHRRGQGPAPPHHPRPARAAQRPAAGGHHHRSADRRAARRRGADREGLHLRRPRHADRRLDQRRRDYPVLQVLHPARRRWSSSLVNLLVDLSYAVIDPRMRVR